MASLKEDASPNGSLVEEKAEGQGQSHEEHRCGLRCCQPECCQKCHNSVCLLVTMCAIVLLQGVTITGFVNASVTMVEKRFNLSSTQIGVISSMYDTAFLVSIIPITYLGGKSHKGRWISVGTIVMGIGAFIYTLPQFFSGKYSYTNERESLCERGTNDTDPCQGVDESETAMFYVFMLGMMTAGVGSTPLLSLAFVYLDENTSKGNSAMFTGIYYGVSVMGGAVGYLLSGVILNVYGDFYRVDDVPLDVDDPQWYGAWWLGFLISTLMAFLIFVPMFTFARHLPGTEKYRAERERSTATVKNLSNTGVRELCSCLKKLLCTPSYLFLILADAVDMFMVIGMAVFLPKYIEKYFHTTAGEAAMYAGGAVVPSGIIGAVLGGVIIKKLKLSTLWIIRFAAISFFATIPFLALFFISCDRPPLMGTKEFHTGLDTNLVSNISVCNHDCECWNRMFDPVCDPSGQYQFLSPCHAGCSMEKHEDKFIDCACVSNYTGTASSVLPSAECEADCGGVKLFLVLLFVMTLLTFLASTPNIQGILRTVEPDLRSLATGLGWVFSRCIGTIPGPIAIGLIIDTSCLLRTEDCGKGQNCLVYDNNQMRINLALLILSFRIASAVLMALASIFHKPGPWEEAGDTNVKVTADDNCGGEMNEADFAFERNSNAASPGDSCTRL